ncbi:ATP-dependent RNA helicase [Spironucleus salmonicida]|uniref:ATP-dependent RNA helicase n=1 Tax=Spironucleus salmonicida TaxID=348837 RepID=V6LSL7_9EUKA|nr:ATP-dependent RNA helicase [Spironucleus salmonicida]|eukprot:EST47605.1 ATP-dependent RNA helicase [Spironucleus salmonicida]
MTTIELDPSAKVQHISSFIFNEKNAQQALKPDLELDCLPWTKLGIHPGISKYLVKHNLVKPTQIQQQVIKPTLKEKASFVISAETGAGKSLAFIMPIIQDLVTSNADRKFKYIIVTPTRELAIQLFSVISDIFKVLNKIYQFSVILVGGLSKDKQNRILQSNPGLVIGTPGRIYELVQNHPYLSDLSSFKRIVIDEADKLLEQGHFADLVKLVQYLNNHCSPQLTLSSATMNLPSMFKDKGMKFQKNQRISNKANLTLSVESDVATEYKNVIINLGFKDLKINFIDNTPEHIVNSTILEKWQFVKSYDEKLEMLTYLILRFDVPTIVFTNSVRESKRLAAAFKLLQINSFAIHAQMPQRQRLKNLDKLKSSNSVLFTTDVCARGIDIPSVKLVIQLAKPTSAATHVHRIGRCARNEESEEKVGLAISLIDKNDEDMFNVIKKICGYDKKQIPEDFKFNLKFLSQTTKVVSALLKCSESESDHMELARKVGVFRGYNELLEADFEGDVLEAMNMKKYHEKVSKEFRSQDTESMKQLLEDIEVTAKVSRNHLINVVSKNLMINENISDKIERNAPSSSQARLLLEVPRKIIVPEAYKFQENLIKSQTVNDIAMAKKRNSKIDVNEEYRQQQEKNKRKKEKNDKKTQKLSKDQKEEVTKDEVVKADVVELKGNADLSIKEKKMGRRQQSQQGNQVLKDMSKVIQEDPVYAQAGRKVYKK